MPATVRLIPQECDKQDQAVADGFGKYTGARSLPLCVRVVCLGDAVKVVVTERGFD